MKNLEIIGLRTEVIGLILVLFATVWQATFTDWFDKNTREWIAYIQEDVNIAILISLNELSLQVSEKDPEKQRNLADKIYKRTTGALSKAIDEREKRNSLDKGQAAIFGKIRYGLLVFGASLILLGKWLVLQHKKAAALTKA